MDVALIGDARDEIDESFTVDLSGAANATIADGQGLGTITDDDPQPSLSVNDVTVTEGNTGTVDATFTVTLSAVSGRAVTVNYATANGTRSRAGRLRRGQRHADLRRRRDDADRHRARQRRRARRGQRDLLPQPVERRRTRRSRDARASARSPTTIRAAVAIDDVTVTEGNTGTVTASFTVTLSPASGRSQRRYATATAPRRRRRDYVSDQRRRSRSPPGDDEAGDRAVHGDVLDEVDETFTVEPLERRSNATIADGQGIGTITDDDPPPALAINDVTVTEGNAGTVDATFTVSLARRAAAR